MNKFLLICALSVAAAQSPKPKPAFAGQTDAPAAAPSADFDVQIVTDHLNSPWSMAFLPDGSFLVTESDGALRLVKSNGFVSAPIEGVPGVKSVGAQGLHEVLLDPDFARNRMVYFTYFAPAPGEPPGYYLLENLYDNVWSKPLADRRVMKIGREKVARARLSDDARRLENLEVIGDGMGERRMVFAPDGTLFISGSDRFWLYESKLDGMEHPL